MSVNYSVQNQPGESPYHTIHPGDTTLESWNVSKQTRSNSWSDSLAGFADDFRPGINSVSSGRQLPSRRPINILNLIHLNNWSFISVASIFLPYPMSVFSGNVPDVTEECKDLSLDFCRNKDFRFLKFQIQFSFTSTDFLCLIL